MCRLLYLLWQFFIIFGWLEETKKTEEGAKWWGWRWRGNDEMFQWFIWNAKTALSSIFTFLIRLLYLVNIFQGTIFI